MKLGRKNMLRASLALGLSLGAASLAIFSCGTDKPPTKSSPQPGTGGSDSEDKEVTFTWDKYTGTVDTFKVYVSDSEDGDFVSLATIDAKDEGFDLESPKATFTTKKTKKLKSFVGGDACFKVTA